LVVIDPNATLPVLVPDNTTVSGSGTMASTDTSLSSIPVAMIEGNSYQCTDDPKKGIARYEGGKMRSYPSTATRLSWIPSSLNPQPIVPPIACQPIGYGARMGMNPDLVEGASYYCDTMPNSIYVYHNGQLRLYPNSTIAKSWNPRYGSHVQTVDCTGKTFGADMVQNV
jgi:hypothetical protein